MTGQPTKNRQLHFRLTGTEHDRITAAAHRRGVSVSTYVRTLALEMAEFPADIAILRDRAPVRLEHREAS